MAECLVIKFVFQNDKRLEGILSVKNRRIYLYIYIYIYIYIYLYIYERERNGNKSNNM